MPKFSIPAGAELFDVDGVPVLKLADGKLVFAVNPSREFPADVFRDKASPADAEDIAFWKASP